MKITSKITLALALLLVVGTGCKKSYLETNPTSSISSNDVFKTTTSAYTALHGIQSFLISDNFFANNHMNWGIKAQDLGDDMMGNDMVGTGSNYDWFDGFYKYQGQLYPTYTYTYYKWLFWYRLINFSNNIIENIDAADGPQDQKDDIKGQALAYRAYAYFKLTTWYQQTYVGNESKPGVPIYTVGTKASNIEGSARPLLSDNYTMIRTDIEEAITLLGTAVQHDDKANITQAVARGIAARIYMVTNEWQKASNDALLALQDYPLMSATEYTGGFNNSTNGEWMWGSTYTSEQYQSLGILDFISFVDQNSPGYAQVGASRAITKALYDTIPSTDIRKSVFLLAGFMQNKFRAQTPNGFVCDYVYMRSSEMYLIQAEAQYRLGNMTAAKDALTDLVAMRDPSYVIPGGDLLDQIKLQRRIELWGEGFAFGDIMRWKEGLNRPKGLGNHKASACRIFTLPAGDNKFIFPIPQREIDANGNIDGSNQNP